MSDFTSANPSEISDFCCYGATAGLDDNNLCVENTISSSLRCWSEDKNREENVGLAFGLVIVAGSATMLGAALVFSPRFVSLANETFLAGSLGFAAGVMLYVSFVEIFVKSNGAFLDDGMSDGDAYLAATLCFFSGFVLLSITHFLTDMLGDSSAKGRTMSYFLKVSRKMVRNQEKEDQANGSGGPISMSNLDIEMTPSAAGVITTTDGGKIGELGEEDSGEDEARESLKLMGIKTAIAIGIHNFPEGLATFVATLDDPAVGATLAIAIAIHNIPEGLCVAIPVFYATGSRSKAMFWAFISGVSEPLGALLGWAILKDLFNDRIYGILFGVVGGMMVGISLKELLPTARRYDPEDKVVSHACIAGMIVMAASLCLFLF